MATEKLIKEWNNNTSWAEIVKITAKLNTRVVIITRYHDDIQLIARDLMRMLSASAVYSAAFRRIVSDSYVIQFATIRDVCVYYYLRGNVFDVAYIVNSNTWRLIDVDCVKQELLPLLGRK